VVEGLVAFVEARLAEDAFWLVEWADGVERKRREAEAKRQRLALYREAGEALRAALAAAPSDDPVVTHSHVRERVNVNQLSGRFLGLEAAVRLDAAVWDDHPEFRAAWRV